MDFAKVSVEIRSTSGKGSSRTSRRAGRVPAVLYGRKSEPVSLTVDPLSIVRSMDKERRRNTVFSLTITDGAKVQDVLAMIRDVQYNSLSRRVVHVDFLRVSMEDDVRVVVPVLLTGMAVGVIDGGQLHQSIHTLLVAAKPNAIPTKIEIDVSALKVGDALHVSDLKMPEGVRSLVAAKDAVASVVAPKAEKEAAVVAEGAAAEGAAAAPAAAAGADAKKGAAGDAKKGDAKAPAAAKDGDKKK